MAMEFSELSQGHPLLQTDGINETSTYWPQKVNEFFLAEFIPLVNYDVDKIVVEFSKQSRGGMTPMVHMGAESPIYDPKTGRGRQEFQAASWREKVHMDADVLYDLREFGTIDKLAEHQRLMDSYVRDLDLRLARRMEWLRRQVLFDGEVTAELPNGTEFKVQYPHPSYLEPTAQTAFNDYANVDVIATLQDVIFEYETTGRDVKEIILPHGMIREMAKGEKFQDLVQYNLGSFSGTDQDVRNRLVNMLGIGNMRESNHRLEFSGEVVADAAAGATSITLDHVEQLKAGDPIFVFCTNTGNRERLEVDSISGTTVTLDTGIQNTGGLKAGDPVIWSRLVIPKGKILMFGDFEGMLNDEGTRDPAELGADPNRWAEIVSTRSHYADMKNPKPGIYSRAIDHTNGDPPHIEFIRGIRALPRVRFNDAWLVLDTGI